MRLTHISFIAFFLLSVNVFAQEDELSWFKGSLVLKSQQVLKGELSVNTNHNVVWFKIGDEQIVYPAHKVQSLYYYDSEEKVNRKFISLQHTVGALTMHLLFETVVYGEVSVLRRQRILPYAIHREVIDFEYFVMKNHGEVLPIRKFKKYIYPSMVATEPEKLPQFVHEQKLNLTRIPHTIRIAEFYNEQNALRNTIAKH